VSTEVVGKLAKRSGQRQSNSSTTTTISSKRTRKAVATQHSVVAEANGDQASEIHSEPILGNKPEHVRVESNQAGILPQSGVPLSLSGVVDAILSVGQERRALLARLRSALISGAAADALLLARQLCGLPNDVTQ
jgi:hypothetical protein